MTRDDESGKTFTSEVPLLDKGTSSQNEEVVLTPSKGRNIPSKCEELFEIVPGLEYDVLTRLNFDFDQVGIQTLDKEELSSLNSIISMVRAEESRRGVM
ncbi:hypothetical protein Ddye_001263 [Dipteronia dyeriana]|uniref:Uncharacterized protein n=1 Tax=Dipteronia dyeriana TaxID=168575 RepID=A0AAD9XN92_9ROSI|nr:hypothetical protein Ddye_001263 [Dipteronia dyeriana]